MAYYPPYVIEKDGQVERTKDIYTRLLQDRIVFLRGVVDSTLADAIVAQLLFLSSDDPSSDIKMYINSPGGSIADGLAIFDTMNYVSCDVSTMCIGGAYSMGAFLLAAGTKGKRMSTKNSRIMIHQPSSATSGKVSDMEIGMAEAARYKKLMTSYLAELTGQEKEKVLADCERDLYMTSQEAVDYGIIDSITVNVQGASDA